MQILSECSANYDYGGAAIVATVFLAVFVILIIGDAVLTTIALWRTLTKIDGQDKKIQVLETELSSLKAKLFAQQGTIVVPGTVLKPTARSASIPPR